MPDIAKRFSNTTHKKLNSICWPSWSQTPDLKHQFYIVWGQKFSDQQLEWAQSRIDKYTDGKAKLTPELCETYKTLGGTPHLDGSYTVFGEVLEGLEIVEKIQYAATDDNDRPINDIRIVSAKVVK